MINNRPTLSLLILGYGCLTAAFVADVIISSMLWSLPAVISIRQDSHDASDVLPQIESANDRNR